MTTNTTTNTLRRSGMGNLWVTGTIEGYRVEAKVFDEASEYSLHGTGISILWITKNDRLVYSFDRGDFECIELSEQDYGKGGDILDDIIAAIEAAR